MTLTDLVFLSCALVFLLLCGRFLVLLVADRQRAEKAGRVLAGFSSAYLLVLVLVAKTTPRTVYPAGVRRCFDDWCVATRSLEQKQNGTWIAQIRISSTAKRVRQRAADAWLELEDGEGRRYPGSDSAGVRGELEPGEERALEVSFLLPRNAHPAGLLVHHGDFPGVLMIGADQSWMHKPGLMLF